MPALLTNHMRPFSHVPGETCMLPRSSWKVIAYPTRISLENLGSGSEKILFSLQMEGPIQGYTLMQDLERDFVRIFGTAKEGYFSFRLTAEPDAIRLLLERAPESGISFSFQGKDKTLKRSETCAFPLPHKETFHPHEKIHFGCHKKQDWTLIKRRLNLDEILPIWFAIGRKCPEQPLHYEGTAKLFKACEAAIQQQDRLEIGPLLIKLFQVGFGGMLTPRLADTDYQGIVVDTVPPQGSPLVLLSHGAELIRQLFINAKGGKLSLLPCLPIELHAGRCTSMQISKDLSIDIEWSKKALRRLVMRPKKNQAWKLDLQRDLKSFRMEGKRFQKEDTLQFKAGKTYLLDRFER